MYIQLYIVYPVIQCILSYTMYIWIYNVYLRYGFCVGFWYRKNCTEKNEALITDCCLQDGDGDGDCDCDCDLVFGNLIRHIVTCYCCCRCRCCYCCCFYCC